MKVYIEYILIDNFVLDYLILLITGKVLRLNYKKYRLIVASIIGSVASILSTIIPEHFLLVITYKFVLGIILVLIAFRIERFRRFIGIYLSFICFTFLMGGLSWTMVMMFNLSTTNLGITGYDSVVPLGVILAGCAICTKLIFRLCLFIYQKRDCEQFLADIEVFVNNKSVKIKGFIDSGNRLFDHVTGLPIIIIATSGLKTILTQDVFEEFIKKTNNDIKKRYNAHFILFQTLSGVSKPMVVFKPDKLLFIYNGRTYQSNVMIGITHMGFKDVSDYDALLHPSMLV